MLDDRNDEVGADERPVIRLVARDFHKQVDEGIAALRTEPDVYARDHDLVHVTHATQADESGEARPDGERSIIAGTPKIHTMAPATLRVRLSHCARWEKPVRTKDGETWALCEPPRSIIEAIHAAKVWPGLRTLRGIIEAPSLRPDGTIPPRV